ncbi:50S ribosomal protein L15 [compost metagenome]
MRTSELAKVEGDVVTLQALKDANVINQNVQRVKVMLSGDVTRAVTLKGIAATKGARAAIEAAGGKIED